MEIGNYKLALLILLLLGLIGSTITLGIYYARCHRECPVCTYSPPSLQRPGVDIYGQPNPRALTFASH